MEMKDRIKVIMEREKLTASIFADTIGVPRSSISHIVSGRNKPSLDFVLKLLEAYPKYNTDWLIKGEGTPIQDKKISSRTKPQIDNNMPELFANIEGTEKPLIQEVKSEITVQANNKLPNIIPESNDLETRENQPQQTETKPEVKSENKVLAHKEVEQIIVCYTDKTFVTYRPE